MKRLIIVEVAMAFLAIATFGAFRVVGASVEYAAIIDIGILALVMQGSYILKDVRILIFVSCMSAWTAVATFSVAVFETTNLLSPAVLLVTGVIGTALMAHLCAREMRREEDISERKVLLSAIAEASVIVAGLFVLA